MSFTSDFTDNQIMVEDYGLFILGYHWLMIQHNSYPDKLSAWVFDKFLPL